MEQGKLSYQQLEQRIKDLELQNSYFRLITNSLQEIVFIISRENKLLCINNYAAEKFGLEVDKIKGENLSDVFPAEIVKSLGSKLAVHFLSGNQSKFVSKINLNRETVWLDINLMPIQEDTEKAEKMLCVIKDISDKIMAEEALQESEEKLKSIVNNIPAAVYRCLHDEHWTMIYISDMIEQISGYPASDFIDNKERSFGSIIVEYDKSYVNEKISKAISEKVPFDIEYKIRLKDGKEKWVHEQGSGAYNEHGDLLFIDGSIIDNTEKKLIEDSLKDSEEKFRTFIENTTDSYFLLKHGLFIECNKTALDIWNCTREDVIGKTPVAFSPEFQPDGRRSDEKAKEMVDLAFAGISHSFYWQHKTKDGQLIDEEVVLKPIQYKGEKVVLAIGRDITLQKKTALALKESEEKYRMLVENQEEGISILSGDEIFMFANPAAEKIFGVSNGGLVNRSLAQFVSSKELERVRKQTEKRLSGEKSSYELEILCAKGAAKTLLVSAAPYLDKDGDYKGSFGIFRDITTLKIVERALQDSENRYRTLAEITDEGIVIHQDGKIVDVNPSLLKMVNMSEEEIKKKSIFEFVHPDYLDFVKAKIEEGFTGFYEIEVINSEGNTIPVEIKVKNLKNKNENLRVFSVHDITERKINEQKLIKSEQKLRMANATKDKFFSIIAHDLKNPVGNFSQLCHFLNKNFEKYTSEELKRMIEKMHRHSDNTFKLLNNLLTWARIQQDKIDLSPEEFCLCDLVKRSTSLLSEDFKRKEIRLSMDVNSEMHPFANKVSIDLVIRNILSNAIKFTPRKGSIDILAKLLENQEGNPCCVELCIGDSGIGIPKTHLKNLFEIDKDYSSQGTEAEEGTGLGLILCKEFVEKNGGAIRVESEESKGSRFIFTIPLRK